MAASNATLTSLWTDDGTGSPRTTPVKTVTGTALKEDTLKFYKEQGLDTLARDAGMLDSNGELMTSYVPSQAQTVVSRGTVQMIAVPITPSPAKSSASQSHLYPRMAAVPSSIAGSPVVVATPHRVISTPGHKGTPQFAIATPVSMESPQQWPSGRKRQIDYIDVDFSDSKRRKGEKGGKGLRHFSMKVCEKVQKKGTTSYNEVADELVAEFTDPRNLSAADQQQYDQKNIRRRVYDALNVLMAMNIISKEKKEIKWIGLPTNSAQECIDLEREKQKRVDRIKQKTQQLQELILQQIAFKNLVQRNRQQEQMRGPPTSNSAIQLPFIIVNTSKKTVIDCSISNDKCEYLFNFDNTFEIHDDIEVLKRMGMTYGLDNGSCRPDDLKKAVKMVPKALEPYVIELAQSKSGPTGSIIPTASIKQEPGTSGMSTPASKYNPQLTAQSPLATPLSGFATLDQTADAEVATAMSHVLSRQSSYSNLTSARDSPEEGYSEESDSERSSPADLL